MNPTALALPGAQTDRRLPERVFGGVRTDVHCDQGLWWKKDELDLVGVHGVLTREEMFVSFVPATLDQL